MKRYIQISGLLVAFLMMYCHASLAAATSLSELNADAERGDPAAEFELGHQYQGGGLGLPQDYNEAAKWYRRAAEQSYAPAESALGILLLNKNDEEAYHWLQKAADQGDSQGKLAISLKGSPVIAYLKGLPQGLKTALIYSLLGSVFLFVILIFCAAVYFLRRATKGYFPKWNWKRFAVILFLLVMIKCLLPLIPGL